MFSQLRNLLRAFTGREKQPGTPARESSAAAEKFAGDVSPKPEMTGGRQANIPRREEAVISPPAAAEGTACKGSLESKGKKPTDRHGFPVLDEVNDLLEIFEGPINKEPDNDFTALFEEKSVEQNIWSIVREKDGGPERRYRSTPVRRSPQSQLDLHGCTGLEAESRTESFVVSAVNLGLSCIRIITGKGLHSDGQPVLPAVVESKLRELQTKKLVKSFQLERRSGGSMIIFL